MLFYFYYYSILASKIFSLVDRNTNCSIATRGPSINVNLDHLTIIPPCLRLFSLFVFRVVPLEIQARGRLALQVYKKALTEGNTCVRS